MFYYLRAIKQVFTNYFQPEKFIKEIATEIFDQGFFGEEKPDVALYGCNDYFIIGCTLTSYEETQRLSFLKDQPGLSDDRHYESDEDQAPPQLIFSVDDSALVVELKAFSKEVKDLVNLYRKVISREELFEMLIEIRDLGIDLYPV